MPTLTPSPGSLARKAHALVFGMLVLGLLAAAALGYAGFQLHGINAAMRDYADHELARKQAESLLSEMEISFTRFLLDGNSANLALLQRDHVSLEQLAQSDASRKDQVLRNMVEQEKRWYSQVAQPLIEQRRNLPPGQGLSEDFLAHYRASGTSQALVTPGEAIASSSAQTVYFVQFGIWLSVAYFAAAILLTLGACVLAWSAFKNIAGLRKTAGTQTSLQG